MEEAGRALVDSGIKNNKTFVISKSYCPFCIKAKTILKYAAGNIADFFYLTLILLRLFQQHY